MHHPPQPPRQQEAPDAPLDVRETYTRKSEFAPHVTVTEETFFGHGWQPLTISFLQALWFLPPGTPFDVPFLVSWLDQIGWKGANGKPIGAKVVRRELALLREAGYVQTHRLRGEGGQAVGIQYTVSQRRIDQPETGSWIPAPADYRRSDHVSPLATCGESPRVANGQNPSSDHVSPLTTRGESPHVVNGAKPQVGPRGTNGVSPPHPPEEVDTSSPYPSTDAEGSVPSPREEEAGSFAAEDIRAAEDFLQRMKKPWNAGRATARKCAPKLLSVMAVQGWPAIHEVDRGLLEREITRNPAKINSHAHILPRRVADLPLYEVVVSGRGPSSPAKNSAGPAERPAVIECGRGCDDGYLEVGDALAPCECLPRRQAARS